MRLTVKNICRDMPDQEKKKIDKFVLHEETNGEFINTVRYLSYHKDRFEEDSVYVVDEENGTVMGVVMATVDSGRSSVLSHGGTTFSGPVLCLKNSYHSCELVMDLLLDYYEKRYKEIKFEITPQFYSKRQTGVIEHILQKRGYRYGMSALSNVIDLFGLSGEDSVFALYDSKRRNQVRKAVKKQAFVVSKAGEISEDIWAAMNENLHNKFGVHSTHSYAEICELHSLFPERIIPYEVYAREGGYAAFALIYKFKNVFHTQYLDVNYAFSGEYPNLFLIHSLMQQAVDEKYRLFSFGTSTERGGEIVNEGLFSYKQGYGGGSIILPVYSKRLA